ncbi:hypothetical protein EGW08_000828 [Elysia chlorotica]|uniref:Methyltransferase domain-containing protein n=1 Tax=Elysia chlorotica TaxID=188477 RepID=A0A3S1A5T2_ELYCH|nr:hypothetical protein EGW08_000828 [Elysia chlorotica]
MLKCIFNLQKNTVISGDFHDEKLSKFSYWKNRYKYRNKDVFEWFLEPGEIVEPILNNIAHIQAQHSVGKTNSFLRYIDIGCGLSDLSLHVLIHCPRPLSAAMVDFVSEALQYQNKRMQEYQQMVQLNSESTLHLICADVLCLPFRAGEFDVAIDKGTMDALLKDKGQGHFKSGLLMAEVTRLLSPGGRYLQISDEDPDSRLLFLESISNTKRAAWNCGKRVEETHEESMCGAAPDFHKLSSWNFKSIQLKFGSEYFLYWAERV